MMVAETCKHVSVCFYITLFTFDGIIFHLHINQCDRPRCFLLRYTIYTFYLKNLPERYILNLF
jgi:hypothetical protein